MRTAHEELAYSRVYSSSLAEIGDQQRYPDHKENMAGIHDGLLLSHADNEILSSEANWMQLDTTIPSQINRSPPKDKCVS